MALTLEADKDIEPIVQRKNPPTVYLRQEDFFCIKIKKSDAIRIFRAFSESFQGKSKAHILGKDVRFSKGIFMKKFLRKDTYIIPSKYQFVNRIFYSLQNVH